MFWILLFFFSLLSADAPTAIAHFEGGSLSVAGGYVNVITGSPLLDEVDLTIPGVETLSFSRSCHYDAVALRQRSSFHTQRWDVNLVESLSRSLGEDKVEQFSAYTNTQETFYFQFEKGSKKDAAFFDTVTYGRG